jgi:hypothetical protein
MRTPVSTTTLGFLLGPVDLSPYSFYCCLDVF